MDYHEPVTMAVPAEAVRECDVFTRMAQVQCLMSCIRNSFLSGKNSNFLRIKLNLLSPYNTVYRDFYCFDMPLSIVSLFYQ